MILKLNILIFTAVSAWMDLKWWKVKNVWLLIGAAAGIPFHLFAEESPGLLSAFGGMLIPILILGGFYRLKKMGAGDVKLFSIVGLYLGAEKILSFLLFAMISGTVYFLALAVYRRSVKRILQKRIHVAVCAFASALCLIGGVYG